MKKKKVNEKQAEFHRSQIFVFDLSESFCAAGVDKFTYSYLSSSPVRSRRRKRRRKIRLKYDTLA